jgi:hypothetical protein
MFEVRNEQFSVPRLNEIGLQKADLIRGHFDNLLNQLTLDLCPEGREFSIVKTKLEEACFFAKKAMAIHLFNQQHDEP